MCRCPASLRPSPSRDKRETVARLDFERACRKVCRMPAEPVWSGAGQIARLHRTLTRGSKEFRPQMHTDAHRWSERNPRSGGHRRPAGLWGIAAEATGICVHLCASVCICGRIISMSGFPPAVFAKGAAPKNGQPPATFSRRSARPCFRCGPGRSCPPGGEPATAGAAIPPKAADRAPCAATESNPIRAAISPTQGQR